MYHGQRVVEVDDNYRIVLKVTDGSGRYMTDASSGLETVKNFAFVTGLVDLARKKAQQKDADGTEYSTEPYPLVMDAPFSNTDEKHIENISRVIPQIAEQVIFVVMEKDWLHAKTVFEGRIGTTYKIDKHSETSSTLRRV
jgi:DNA sulfur modification protein DndD